MLPDQVPEAVQDVALVDDQVSVADPPLETLVGLALKARVGSGKTVTVTLCIAVPPAPVQLKVNVLVAASAPVDSLPSVALVPDQAPEAVQEAALVDDHVSVVALPFTTLVGLAPKLRVGSGRTVTVTFAEALPPAPMHVSE